MKDFSHSNLSESPGVHLSNLLCVPVMFKWANTENLWWTYKRASVLGNPSWAKMGLYLGQKQQLRGQHDWASETHEYWLGWDFLKSV